MASARSALLVALSAVTLAACGSSGSGGGSGSGSGSGSGGGGGSGTGLRRADCKLSAAGCHDAAECNGRGICEAAPPSSDYGCGIPPRQVEACRADADCKAGEVCNAFRFGCDVGHRCEPRCNAAGCQDGWACGADGRCAPRRCPADWDCADYGTCKPPAAGEGPLQGGRDWHGCVPLACTRDADCPCAHCVNHACTPISGRCIEPRG